MIFQAEDVIYNYSDDIIALDNINIQIEEGEKVAVLGANGSGKSTLLHLLNGLCFAGSGSVFAFGQQLSEDIFRDPGFILEFRRKVGFVFQNPDIQLFSATVWDEIAFGPQQLGLSQSDIEKRVEDVLDMLGIEKLRGRHPYRLSGGEKKKVAIASVLSCNPSVLLFDEPTAALDPRTQAWVVDCIMELNSAGKTIVTATHDLSTVQEIADRVYVLGEDHKIIAEGKTATILEDEQVLIKGNLAHYHYHKHGSVIHTHEHRHYGSGHHDDHDHVHDR
jgi:cobalt/nickel transport system ATP-binding protein